MFWYQVVVVTSLLAITGISIIKRKTIVTKINQGKALYQLYNSLTSVLDESKSHSEKSQKSEKSEHLEELSSIKMCLGYALLTYKRLDKKYTVYIPYNRKNVISMENNKVLLYKGNEVINITQQAGIPYLLSAEELGGEKIVIENTASGNCTVYEKKTIPGYGM